MKVSDLLIKEEVPSTEFQDTLRQVKSKGKGIAKTEFQNVLARKSKKIKYCPDYGLSGPGIHGKYCRDAGKVEGGYESTLGK